MANKYLKIFGFISLVGLAPVYGDSNVDFKLEGCGESKIKHVYVKEFSCLLFTPQLKYSFDKEAKNGEKKKREEGVVFFRDGDHCARAETRVKQNRKAQGDKASFCLDQKVKSAPHIARFNVGHQQPKAGEAYNPEASGQGTDAK